MSRYNLLLFSKKSNNVHPCVPTKPVCQKNDKYFDLKYPKIYTHLIITYNFYKLCSIATRRHPKPLLLENRIYIVALTLNL